MNIELSRLSALALQTVKRVGRFKVVLFIVFVLGLYGYVVYQIGQANSAQPSADQQITATKASPHVDPAVVQQLQQLQDNSVSVKALFNTGRSNPFQ